MNGSSGGSVAMGLIALPIVIVLYVWVALALAAVFRKVGERSGKAWVPFLNLFVVLELGGISGWAVLLGLVPILGSIVLYVLVVVAAHRITLAFGYRGGMTVLAAFLWPVWASVLGFGSARWLQAPAPASPAPDRRAMPLAGRTGSPAHLASPLESDAALSDAAPSGVRSTSSGWPVWAEDADLQDDLDDSAVVPGVMSPAPVSATASEVASAPVVPPLLPTEVPSVPLVTRSPFVPSRPVEPAEPWAPRRSQPADPDEVIDETSGEVSAVVGAPDAGAPRSALSSVSALHARPEAVDDDDFDETVITRRRRARWALVPRGGAPIDLVSDVVIVGRSPVADVANPRAQLVSIADVTRTVSKTHARLELRGDSWFVTDLGSTNGVLLVTLTGTEMDAEPGAELSEGERFFLGDAEVRLQRTGA